jgi:hypothetical protein
VKTPISNLNKIDGRIYTILKKMHLCPYANWALLWINMAENLNYPITYGMKAEKTKTVLTD